ncbi:MAG: carboxypeptidase M32 [Clostridia bacterium]|nr:carboxypeptidase M32 [Clostridia bacterium]
MENTKKTFRELLDKIQAYGHAMSKMYYDSVTVMPKRGNEAVGRTLGVLSEEEYKLSTSEELKSCTKELLAHKDELDAITAREAELTWESFSKLEKIPMDEYVQYQMDVNTAQGVWHEAKVKSDFAMFAPHLEKLVKFNRNMARYIDPEKPPYDVLLDEYEKGMTMEKLDEFFAKVRAGVVPLLKAVMERGRKIDVSFLEKDFAIDKQREFSEFLMKLMRMDKERSAIGETEHPFTINFTKNDVRITTHYHEDMLLSSLYSVVHEAGHATYELNIGDELAMTTLGTGVSMGVHESQSRFYENIIGRSREFVGLIYGELVRLFPQEMEGVTEEQLYLAVNRAQPSLIRTEADELTYALHVMVRYEIEKKLIAGEIEVAELPKLWNELYKEYLGVDVPDDKNGVLQDSHWSGGSFGYFPSYAIGSAYAAQLLSVMEEEMDVFAQVKSGDLQPIIDWLTCRIYKFGCLKKPGELIEQACGKPFDPQYYIDYLTKKFTEVYKL